MPKTLLPEIQDSEAIKALAEAVASLLHRWGLRSAEQRQLLGMEDWTGAGKDSRLPDDPAVLERFGHLLAIGRALKKLDPESPDLGDWWIRTPQPVFGGQSPLAVMITQGVKGIEAVRTTLESD